MATENATDPTTGTDPSEEGTPQNDQAEITQLRQKLAESREYNRRAEPVIALAQKLHDTPGGKEIIQRVRNDQPLTLAQEVKVAKATGETAGGESTEGLTEARIREVVREETQASATALEQKLYESRKAEKDLGHMDDWAEENLDGYANIKNTAEFNSELESTLQRMQDKDAPLLPPDDHPDPYRWAVERAYKVTTGLGAGEKKERPAKKDESARRASIAAQAGRKGGEPEGDGEHSNNPDLNWARSSRSTVVGKSFGS